jgi:acetylornithine deacetylase/succinyl-diaminopimelate desuccinylase-like protein
MKSGLVVLLYALRIINECKVDLKEKITFSIVPDEETGGTLGTKYLFDNGILPMSKRGMLMPEPTSGVIWNANKGALTCKVTIKGKTAHVALEQQGGNAFEKMLEIAGELREFKKKVMKRKTSLPVSPPEASRSVMLMGGESGSGANFNVVPEEAFFTIDRRFNPEENLDTVRQELFDIINKYKNKNIGVEIEIIQEGESSETDTENKMASALKQSIFEVTGKEPAFGLCPGVCEIRFFNKQGIPAYAYGPGLLEVSHGSEEYVRIQDMLDCTKIYALSVIRSAASL